MKLFRRILSLIIALVAGTAHAMPPFAAPRQGRGSKLRRKNRNAHDRSDPGRNAGDLCDHRSEDATATGRQGRDSAALSSADPVKVYYRTERGQRVATEISWWSESKKEKP